MQVINQGRQISSNPRVLTTLKRTCTMNRSFVGPEMTAETAPKGQLIWRGSMVLVTFSGLCAIFVSVVTVAEAWREHAEARWPAVTARVDTCGLDQHEH